MFNALRTLSWGETSKCKFNDDLIDLLISSKKACDRCDPLTLTNFCKIHSSSTLKPLHHERWTNFIRFLRIILWHARSEEINHQNTLIFPWNMTEFLCGLKNFNNISFFSFMYIMNNFYNAQRIQNDLRDSNRIIVDKQEI